MLAFPSCSAANTSANIFLQASHQLCGEEALAACLLPQLAQASWACQILIFLGCKGCTQACLPHGTASPAHFAKAGLKSFSVGLFDLYGTLASTENKCGQFSPTGAVTTCQKAEVGERNAVRVSYGTGNKQERCAPQTLPAVLWERPAGSPLRVSGTCMFPPAILRSTLPSKLKALIVPAPLSWQAKANTSNTFL